MLIHALLVLCILVPFTASAAESDGPAADVLQVVTLADGRKLEGRLNADRTELSMQDGKTGKFIAKIAIDPAQIVEVAERRIAAPVVAAADVDDAAATPEERERNRAERAATLAMTKWTQAKARKARALKANDDMHARNKGRTITNKDVAKQEKAKVAKVEKEMADAKEAEQAAQAAFAKAADDYRKLGGTKNLEEPTVAK